MVQPSPRASQLPRARAVVVDNGWHCETVRLSSKEEGISRLRITGSMCVVMLAVLLGLASMSLLQRTTAQGPVLEAALGSAFTYQGQLQTNGAPATGSFDFQFILYDAAVGGSQVSGSPIVTKSAVAVTNGVFTTQLDFGDVLGNSQLFLDISVRPAGSGNYTPLTPRQELTPAPLARYALKAGSAVVAQSAQSVAWSNVTGKPGPVTRQLVVPAGAMSYIPSGSITPSRWGVNLADTADVVSFVVPQPADWDQSKPFTITLNFALPSPPSSSGTVQWRLQAGGAQPNASTSTANDGRDSLNFWTAVDAPPLTYPAVSGGYVNLVKSQSWTAQFDNTFNAWYFGSSVTVANNFGNNAVWYFSFQRGRAAGNSESYTGNLTVVSAEISYVSK